MTIRDNSRQFVTVLNSQQFLTVLDAIPDERIALLKTCTYVTTCTRWSSSQPGVPRSSDERVPMSSDERVHVRLDCGLPLPQRVHVGVPRNLAYLGALTNVYTFVWAPDCQLPQRVHLRLRLSSKEWSSDARDNVYTLE